jgi:hypothetical protein
MLLERGLVRAFAQLRLFRRSGARSYRNGDKTRSISLLPMNGAITPPTP